MLKYFKINVLIVAFFSSYLYCDALLSRDCDKQNLAAELFYADILSFGAITLKSSTVSPYYIDLRKTISYPSLLSHIAQMLNFVIDPTEYDLICGVPYGAVPLATTLSTNNHIPLIMQRKEIKGYGKNNAIEGVFNKGQRCLLIEDVIVSGESILKSIQILEHEGLRVGDIVVIVDRQQGGVAYLKNKGYNVHVLFTIKELLTLLQQKGLIQESTVCMIDTWTAQNQINYNHTTI